jgi:hypothetical protein
MSETPIALFIFNRPDLTSRLLEAVKAAPPRKLFVIADGPRPQHTEDLERCSAARAALGGIDGAYEVVRDFSPVNLGCGRRVSSGINWVLGQVDEAIFLEDDCLPDPTFFRFCDELLDRYRHDERVMMISGTNPLGNWRTDIQSYHFSRFGSHWGWATWERAWRHYDFEMKTLERPDTRARLSGVIGDAGQAAYHLGLCEAVARGQLDTWDCQWTLAQLLRAGLAAVPAANLVTNTGFGRNATHTRQNLAMGAHLEREAMTFPLRAPRAVEADGEYDRQYIAWRRGRPDAALVLALVEQQLAAGRNIKALLWLEAALREGLAHTDADRARIHTLKEHALAGLGPPLQRAAGCSPGLDPCSGSGGGKEVAG